LSGDAPLPAASSGMARELAEFTILQAYDTSHAIAKGGSRWSDLEGSALIWRPLDLDGLATRLRPARHTHLLLQHLLPMQPPWKPYTPPSLYMGRSLSGSFLQLSYNYIAPGRPRLQPGVNSKLLPVRHLRAYYDLIDRVGLFFAPSYDIANSKMLRRNTACASNRLATAGRSTSA